MIRVVIAEDEPAAMQYISSLVRKCYGMGIIAQAENGLEAIKILEAQAADILITDVQMPHMNGVELAKWASENKPEVLTLIVSGHSDFEFAKEAIKAGVVEYLLKPLTPTTFAEAMHKLFIKVMKKRRTARELWLKQAIAGVPGSYDFPGLNPCDPIVLGAVIGGAVADFHLPGNNDFIYPDGSPLELSAVYIHNKSEICFAYPACLGTGRSDLISLLSENASYYTAVVKSCIASEGKRVLYDMQKTAKRTAVPGVSQILEFTEMLIDEPIKSDKEHHILSKLQYSIANVEVTKIKTLLVDLFAVWETEKRSLAAIEFALARLLQRMANYAPPGHGLGQQDIAENVPNLCRKSANLAEILQLIWQFCSRFYETLERQSETGQLISSIEKYIKDHLGEPLTTSSICAVFKISSSHLYRIFRKHIKMSFVEYVTKLRIDEAMRMIEADPEVSIKTVAEQLGFSDQFYFSKVFRSQTGVSPSEFRRKVIIE